MNNPEDKDLNEYLQGESELSQVYQSSMNQQPSSRMDQMILNAAKTAADKTKRTAPTSATTESESKEGFFSRLFSNSGWLVPTASLASFAVIAVVVAVLVTSPEGNIDDTNIAHINSPTTSGMQTVNSVTKAKSINPAGDPKKMRITAEIWIENIKVLHQQGDIETAKKSLILFQNEFPKYPADKLQQALKNTGLTQ